ncbi:alpha/beta fold hydrolase [Glaciecola siphonariae]|uniref:Alpha/beta fold hydrolase n=1 Tax=Glaciecola siphonariae TaxID=521012 RepID=A0ABV9LSM7_9ALTE
MREARTPKICAVEHTESLNAHLPEAHFAHANGFPAGSYQQLFKYLEKHLQVFALDKFAHNPQYPLVDNWVHQVDELIDFVEHNKQSEKVVALGHSFGAVISYIACCKRPDLFSGLLMLDPPLATGFARHIFRFAKSNRLINKVTPAAKTQMRKQSWHKDDDLLAYFKARALFKNMDERCVLDYINSVTAVKGDYRHLMFKRDIEAQIFRTLPHNLHDYFGQLQCPATLITARYTDVCTERLRKPFLKHNPGVKHLELHTGGHMFPLEHPKLVAEAVINELQAWHLQGL